MAGSAFPQLGRNAVFLYIERAELVDFRLGLRVDLRNEIVKILEIA